MEGYGAFSLGADLPLEPYLGPNPEKIAFEVWWVVWVIVKELKLNYHNGCM